MTRIVAQGLSKHYSETKVINNLSFKVEDGEFLTLLGSSGCGKTTTLRLILGTITPNSGRIFFDETEVTHLPCQKRDVGIVYQNYALFPHMTVYENIAFGLRARGIRDVDRRVLDEMEVTRIGGLGKRFPGQLSGGQQQRVALARTLVVKPKVLLLDEPLSNVDAKLRLDLCSEIRRVQRELKITTIYVTHDQEEAISMSDRIAIMNQGRIVESGEPKELYLHPKYEYTREFMGVVAKKLENFKEMGLL